MNVFVPNVMWIDENNQWQTLFYPNLPLTIKRLKECRREQGITLKEFSNGIRINADCLKEIELGESLMGPSWLEIISNFYNKPIEFFTFCILNQPFTFNIANKINNDWKLNKFQVIIR